MNVSLDGNRVTPASGQSRGKVFLLALGTFAVGTDAFVVAGFLPQLSAELGVSVATAGQSVTVFAICYALFSPVIATLAATVPRRRLLILALVVLGLGNIGSAISPTFGILNASRIVAAAGAASFTPNAGAVASIVVDSKYRGRALAVVVSGLTIATAIGVPVGTFASRAMGWRTALTYVALLCFAVALGLRLFLPQLEGGQKLALSARLTVLRNPVVRVILPVTILGMTAAYTAYAYALPAFAAVGVSADASPLMLFLYGVGAVAGAQASGRLTDRFGGFRVLFVGYLLMIVTLLALGTLSVVSLVVPAVVAFLAFTWGASSWCQTPPQQHRLVDAAPEHAPLVIALNSSAIYLGIGAGTLVGGMTGPERPSWLFFSGALIAILAGVFLLVTRRSVGAPDATIVR